MSMTSDIDYFIHLIGMRLRDARIEKGYSQEGLAVAFGLHRNYIGMVERGERNNTIKNYFRFCRALDLDMSEPFGSPPKLMESVVKKVAWCSPRITHSYPYTLSVY